MPEVDVRNFLWASDFPGLDSPWPHSKAMGHAPVEPALGKEALNQLVFDNAVRLYKIPVTLPPERAHVTRSSPLARCTARTAYLARGYCVVQTRGPDDRIILDGYSRTMLAGAIAPAEASWLTLMVLYTTCLRSGALQHVISDSGGAFTSSSMKIDTQIWWE